MQVITPKPVKPGMCCWVTLILYTHCNYNSLYLPFLMSSDSSSQSIPGNSVSSSVGSATSHDPIALLYSINACSISFCSSNPSNEVTVYVWSPTIPKPQSNRWSLSWCLRPVRGFSSTSVWLRYSENYSGKTKVSASSPVGSIFILNFLKSSASSAIFFLISY